MRRRLLAALVPALLAGCAVESNWSLMESGYSINPLAGQSEAYAIEVHRNQLKQIGGEVNSAEFSRFAAERLRWHGLCPKGWQPLPCVRDGSCIQHTSRSVTVPGRCLVS
jgi:hypothetical protein